MDADNSVSSDSDSEVGWDFAASLEEDLLEKADEDVILHQVTNGSELQAHHSKRACPLNSGGGSPVTGDSPPPHKRRKQSCLLKTIGKVKGPLTFKQTV